jgi:hypothetical protein
VIGNPAARKMRQLGTRVAVRPIKALRDYNLIPSPVSKHRCDLRGELVCEWQQRNDYLLSVSLLSSSMTIWDDRQLVMEGE